MTEDLKPVWAAIKNDGGSSYYYGETLRDYLLKRPTPVLEVVTTHSI